MGCILPPSPFSIGTIFEDKFVYCTSVSSTTRYRQFFSRRVYTDKWNETPDPFKELIPRRQKRDPYQDIVIR